MQIREAAVDSINKIGLDYYLQKPWDPPEEHLYPILDELLADWQASTSLPYEGIRVAGTLWSVNSHNVKRFSCSQSRTLPILRY